MEEYIRVPDHQVKREIINEYEEIEGVEDNIIKINKINSITCNNVLKVRLKTDKVIQFKGEIVDKGEFS